ncbi:MAG TPA: DUF222 domain-containing protein, partial [Acidimicrobiales bacterium]|nr:DUF222 domain-containing protein [Acidimicrobiales bacterium]
QFDRFEARCARAAVDFEAGGSWIADGARSAGAWIARRCHTAKSHAFRLVRLGRAVSKRQALAAAWFDGEVGSTQVGLIAGLENRRTAEALRRDEEMLVGQAKELSAEEFAHACQYWAQLADPDGAEQSERDRIDRRDVQLHPSISGTWFGSMTLDPVSGEIVNDELCRIENELFEADWKEATDRLGRRPGAHELQRTGSQRRADSLVEMAARSAAATAGTRYPVPLFNVLIDFDTFGRVCELASGAVTTPGNLVKYLATADWERALFRPPNRVDVGRRARFFTGATRRAIELRDRHCVHAYCDVPASRCQVDHIVPYAQGGETVQENGRLLCPAHNRARNNEPRARLPEPPGDPPDGPDPGPEHDPPRLDDP